MPQLFFVEKMGPTYDPKQQLQLHRDDFIYINNRVDWSERYETPAGKRV